MIQPDPSPRTTVCPDVHLNRGRLRNGNPSGDYLKAPRCGAKTRADGCACRQPAMRNGRCRFHGGKSTGARTAAGRARRTHGFYSADTVALRRQAQTLLRRNRDLLTALRGRPAGYGVLPSKSGSPVGPAPCGRPVTPSHGRPHGGAPTMGTVIEPPCPAGHGVLRSFLRFAARCLGLQPDTRA